MKSSSPEFKKELKALVSQQEDEAEEEEGKESGFPLYQEPKT